MPFEIKFAADVRQHLEGLTARERSMALEGLERRLLHEPLVETRNRKPLRPNPVAPWELRLGNLRVFYEVIPGDPGVVRIVAVGKKKKNVVRIAGKEIQL